MSLYNIPRIISLFEESNTSIQIPRGLEQEVSGLIPHITWKDQTTNGRKIHSSFNGKLRSEQKAALDALLAHHDGILSARTGFGKTVVAAQLIAKLNVSTLILVHDKEIAKQWVTQLNEFLSISDKPFVQELTPTGRKKHKEKIGSYYGTKHSRSGIIDVATIQSFKDDVKSKGILNQYGLVISDEVHHDAAFTFEQVIKQIKSTYLYGLSATPYRRDGQDPIITMRFGPVRYKTSLIDEKSLAEVKRTVIPRFTNFGISDIASAAHTINENYDDMVKDSSRNQSIIKDINKCLHEERHVLVLTKRIEHVRVLASLLNRIPNVFLLYGDQTDKENAESIAKINQTTEKYVLLATNKYAGEGLDIPSLDTLILAMPHSWKGSSIQYLGRTQRNLTQKSEIRVYDYVDMFIPMLAQMYRKRLKTYYNLHYKLVQDERSQQNGIKFYDGKYQAEILSEVKNANDIFACGNQFKFFIPDIILPTISINNEVRLLSNSFSPMIKGLLKKLNASYTSYDQNLPNCLVLNNKQIWISSDVGFDRNTGITICIDQPQLVSQFVKMLMHTIDTLN